MKLRLALLCLLALACDRAAKTPAAAAPAPAAEAIPEPDVAGNLLDLARGASVITRTGEHSYENSASHAIDGDSQTHWISPPSGPEQTLVFSLATPARVRRLGLTTTPGSAVRQLRVESSTDGSAWQKVATLSFEEKSTPQMHDVAPFEARFLRMRTVAPGQHFTLISTIYAMGDELGPSSAGSIDGCWTIDGRPARFEQRGAHILGVIEPRPDTSDAPVQIEGGFDGRTHRMAWRSGAQWGFALLTVSPDGRTISGLRWHERTDNEGAGDGWLGPRGPCATTPFDPDAIRTRILGDRRRYPLYGLRFDAEDKLIVDQSTTALDFLSRWPLIGRPLSSTENGRPAAGATKALRLVSGSKARLDSLRAALAARGVDMRKIELAAQPEQPSKTLAQKVLAASVEIETR